MTPPGGDDPKEPAAPPRDAAAAFGRTLSERRVGGGPEGDAAATSRDAPNAAPRAPTVRRPSFAAVQPPKLELPKGGGALRGLGETYRTNPATGTASFEIPLPVTALARGPLPPLALRYDSGGGQGPFGIGWSLALPAIRRRTDRGVPRYDGRDALLHGGEGELVRVAVEGGVERYRPRQEGGFSRIERTVATDTFRTIDRGDVTTTFGVRLAHPVSGLTFAWLADEIRDDRGNVVSIGYLAENLVGVPKSAPEASRHAGLSPIANLYPAFVRYGNTDPGDEDTWSVEIAFDWGGYDDEEPAWSEGASQGAAWTARPDPFSDHRGGFDLRTYRRCRRVLVFHRFAALASGAPQLVRALELGYADDAHAAAVSRLTSVRLVGYGRNVADTADEEVSLPALELGYSPVKEETTPKHLPGASQAELPAQLLGAEAQWIDLDGEGLPGVLVRRPHGLGYLRNDGAGVLCGPRPLPTQPALASLGAGGTQLADVDGTGRLGLVAWGGATPGFHARTGGDGWGPFEPFESRALVDFESAQTRFVDLDGDGVDDVLVARGDHLLYFRGRGREGFEAPVRIDLPRDEAQGPVFAFGDRRRAVFLADMTGDGLADLVVVTASRVAYWPALGRGRFCAQIVMAGSPQLEAPDLFDGARVRLADLDGSGPADLLYFGVEGARVHRNQAGNAFGPPLLLNVPWRATETAATVDLLGRGTTSIVYALREVPDAPLRYVDLQGGAKPHLLSTVDNGLGRTVSFTYAASTKFALADRKAGRPWVTQLPFPVQVVERMTVHDGVRRAGTVSRYAYHHGFYDGEEREFAGFAFVEQRDAESFDATEGLGEHASWPEVEEGTFSTPTALTKSWFHTGAFRDRGALEADLATEWWAPSGAPAPPALTLPTGLSAFDRRECVRALRGALLRREVYGLDGTDAASRPYLVEQHGHEVRLLHATSGNAKRPRDATPGVTFRFEREVRHAVHERVEAGPRIVQHLTLAVDTWGTTTREAVVAYPRPSATEPAQQALQVAVSERDVAHLDETDARRLAVPTEERLFQLTGASPGAAVFTPAELDAAFTGASALGYHETPTSGAQRRLLDRVRTVYFDSDDLPTALAHGTIDERALPYESHRLELTDELLDALAMDTLVTSTILTEGGYVELSGEDGWWTPSGRAVPSAAAFYQPTEIRDARGRVTSLTHDAEKLFVVEAEDAVGNVVSATVDYRATTLREITDPNGNRVEGRVDALGRLTHLAAKGKTTESLGDTLADPTEEYQHDATRWRTAQKPTYVRALLRETHGSGSNFLESYTYADGGGGVAMVKRRAAPGLSPHHEDGELVRDGEGKPVLDEVDPRWVGTGRTVLDNKGMPVKQYEAYFSDQSEYEDEPELVEWGVSPLIAYDAIGRVVRVDHPDGSFETFARPDAWTEISADRNDNDTGGPHEDTPTTTLLDPLGRAFQVDLHNGGSEHHVTTLTLDLEGAVLAVEDAHGRTCVRYDLSVGGQLLRETSIDAGERKRLANVLGSPLRVWDARGQTHRFAYDDVERPTHRWLTPASASEVLLQRVYYGEAASSPEASNLRGQVHLHYDAAGQTKTIAHDFRGRLVEQERKLATDYTAEPDWSALESVTSPATAESTAASALESETFGEERAYDALGRITSLTTPDDTEVRTQYDEGGQLFEVDARVRGAGTWTSFVDSVAYDAKGRREEIVYGNGTKTVSTYDELTFRLVRTLTTRTSDSAVLQDLSYTYDPVGNILTIEDDSDREVLFDNTVASPHATYAYDAVYRLINATGREHAGGVGDVQRGVDDLPLHALPHPNDPTAVRLYEEEYVYDVVGNLLELAHTAVGNTGASWTRRYDYGPLTGGVPDTNRLRSTSLPGDTPGTVPYTATHTHDAHGNITAMPHLASITYDHADRMREADLGGGGTAYYVYRADGSRARKVIERIGTLVEERIYLGSWEVYRKRDHTGLLLERETLHVMDDRRRVAMVETKTVEAGVSFTVTPRYRFQLDDQIWSARLECDETGLVISYEEHHPYGTSAYRSSRSGVEVSERRFRYTGKERDEETGFQIHGLRYYCPWLGRWTTADPIGLQGGVNQYAYCRGDPVGKVDPGGTDAVRVGPIGICPKPPEQVSQVFQEQPRGPPAKEPKYNPNAAPSAGPAPARPSPTRPELPADGGGGAGGAPPAAPPSPLEGVHGGAPDPADAGQVDPNSVPLLLGLAAIPVAGLFSLGPGAAVAAGAGYSATGATHGEAEMKAAAGLSLGLGGRGATAERKAARGEGAASRVGSADALGSAGAMRRLEFEASPKHPVGVAPRPGVSPGPRNGQAALDVSVEAGKRRVGIDYDSGEFVVFDETFTGRSGHGGPARVFHGHVRPWDELRPDMQKALKEWGMVTPKGKIIMPPAR